MRVIVYNMISGFNRFELKFSIVSITHYEIFADLNNKVDYSVHFAFTYLKKKKKKKTPIHTHTHTKTKTITFSPGKFTAKKRMFCPSYRPTCVVIMLFVKAMPM